VVNKGYLLWGDKVMKSRSIFVLTVKSIMLLVLSACSSSTTQSDIPVAALQSSGQMVDKSRIGVLGHSYGGNTVLFQAAINEEIKFACSSSAACIYKNKCVQIGRVYYGN
jgi:dienelactone hydrolase